ncbi:hypothetical protein VTI74DRAFT_248 [Chaetomium olivicolor]
MSNLRYFNTPSSPASSPTSRTTAKQYGSATASSGSGQGGWDPTTGAIRANVSAEIDQAFADVDACLHSASSKRWSQVYRINFYTTELREELFGARVASMKKWLGEGHRPLLTGVAVAGIRVETGIAAHDPEGQTSKERKD